MPGQVTGIFGSNQLDHMLEPRPVVTFKVGHGDDVVFARLLSVEKWDWKMNRSAGL